MTLIDLFREFSSVSTRELYSTSSRVLYYTLLYLWNEQRRPEIASLTSKQLYTLAGLPETTFRDAFKYLADRGWVKRLKSRRRGITAWQMRFNGANAAPAAGFPMDAPAQRVSEEGEKSAPPKGGFFPRRSRGYRAQQRFTRDTRETRNVENTLRR